MKGPSPALEDWAAFVIRTARAAIFLVILAVFCVRLALSEDLAKTLVEALPLGAK